MENQEYKFPKRVFLQHPVTNRLHIIIPDFFDEFFEIPEMNIESEKISITMNSSDIFKDLVWILNPLCKLIVWMFSSTPGIIILIVLLLGYLVAKIALAFSGKSSHGQNLYGRSSTSNNSLVLLGLKIILSSLMRLVYKIPVVLGIIIVLFSIQNISEKIAMMDKELRDSKKNTELGLVLQQITEPCEFAEMEVLNVDPFAGNKTQIRIKYFDRKTQKYRDFPQEIILQGNDVFFESKIIDFEWCNLGTANKRKLAFPALIYTAKATRNMAIELQAKDSLGIPYFCRINEEQIMGMPTDTFSVRLNQLFRMIEESTKSKEFGIRSMYSIPFIQWVAKGQVFKIMIEPSGLIKIIPKISPVLQQNVAPMNNAVIQP